MTVQMEGRTLVVRDEQRPNAKQRLFYRAAANPAVDEILFHGAIRSGKTQSALKVLLAWAWRYPGQYAIFRATRDELEDSTKKALLRGDGIQPPVLDEALIKKQWGQNSMNKVWLRNGAEILFRSLEPDERGKIRNLTLAGFFIDQVEELDHDTDEDYYDELMGRLSDPSPHAPRKSLLVANPGPEDHWVCRRFNASDLPERTAMPRTAHVHVRMIDNAENLNPDYVEKQLSYRETRPDYYARMVEGLWGAFGGKRFKSWRADVNLYPRNVDIHPDWEILEGGDWGYEHPAAWVWVAVDEKERWWVTVDHRENHRSVSWHSKEIHRIRQGFDGDEQVRDFIGDLTPSVTWLDSQAWAGRDGRQSIAHEFADYGIYCAKAQKDRKGGWNRIDEMLTRIMDDGYSQLRFCPAARACIEEIPNLRIDERTDDVLKTKDDASDALRYIVNSRYIPPEEEPEPEEEWTREAVARRMIDKAHGRDQGRHIEIT